MLYHDQPITHPGQDLYRRSEFALTIARTIDELSIASDGFAFALTGEWGTGKSSTLRMVERYLMHIQMEKRSQAKIAWKSKIEPASIEQLESMALLYEKVEPTIKTLLESNQYYIRSSLDYQASTFNQILQSEPDTWSAVYYWYLKQPFIDSPDTIVIHFSPWLIAGRAELASALLSELARALGVYLGDPVKEAFQNILIRLAEFAPVAGAGLDVAGYGFGSIVRASAGLANGTAKRMATGPTLDQLRTELRNTLRGLKKRKILVVVDDIDRLTPSEAAEMIALVKSLGDLPNVIYLLSYDRERVCGLLERALHLSGEEYLEKIVQQHIDLPPIEPDDILRTVDENIKSIFKGITFDDKRLGRFWYQILRHYLKTPRDVRRYFNSLALAQSGLAQSTDPVDLMAIQALLVFEPAIHAFIRDNYEDLI